MFAALSDSAFAIVALIVGPLFAYIGISRRLSGKIGTSEAADLWAESRSLREDAAQKLALSEGRINVLEVRVRELEKDNTRLSEKNFELVQKISVDEMDIKALRSRIEALERENANLRDLVSRLQRSQERDSSTPDD